MELKSLIMGLLFGLGIFAFKSGVGLGYLLSASAEPYHKRTLVAWHVLTYMALFPFSCLLLEKVSLLEYFPQLQQLFAGGMTLHLISALVMAAWGLWLLIGKGDQREGPSKGWLLLSLPCPVCASVILLETAFVMNLYPEQLLPAITGMALVFALIQLFSALVLYWKYSTQGGNAEQLLGQLMCLLAGYFLLSVCLVPQFSQIERIYRLAAADQGKGGLSAEMLQTLAVVVLVIVAGWLARTVALRRSC